MTNGAIIIKDKDWERATPEQRDWMIFNTLQSLDRRLQKLERQPWIDKSLAFIGGVIGGGLAFLGIQIGS
jgi:hypothetical protein